MTQEVFVQGAFDFDPPPPDMGNDESAQEAGRSTLRNSVGASHGDAGPNGEGRWRASLAESGKVTQRSHCLLKCSCASLVAWVIVFTGGSLGLQDEMFAAAPVHTLQALLDVRTASDYQPATPQPLCLFRLLPRLQYYFWHTLTTQSQFEKPEGFVDWAPCVLPKDQKPPKGA